MSHEVESMFSVRQVPWHGLGTVIQEAVCSDEALKIAGLDWEIRQERLTYAGVDTDYLMNIRSSDQKVLGVVGNRYKPVQNREAFAFTDCLLGEGVKYETAGSLYGGRRIWMLAKMPDITIFDDVVEPYLCLNNVHDGGGSMKVCMTPVRVVCNNTLNLALKEANRIWTMRHIGNIEGKLDAARQTLGLANEYMTMFQKEAQTLYEIKIAPDVFHKLSETLFPVTADMTQRKEESQLELQSNLEKAWNFDDLGNIRNTGWGFMNAVSDMSTHRQPARKTAGFKDTLFLSVIDMPALLDQALQLVKSIA